MQCDHANYDEYFEQCPDCKTSGADIHKQQCGSENVEEQSDGIFQCLDCGFEYFDQMYTDCDNCGELTMPIGDDTFIGVCTACNVDNRRPVFIENITAEYGVGITLKDEYVSVAAEEYFLGFSQFFGSSDHCDSNSYAPGGESYCNYDGLLWQAHDMGSPYFCTNHFFDTANTGYEFMASKEAT